MRRESAPVVLLSLGLLYIAAPTPAQAPADVLRLYGPGQAQDVRIVDTNNTVVHTWQTQFNPGLGIDLIGDGSLIRAIRDPGSGPASNIGGAGGGLQRLAFDGTVLWDFRYNHPGVLSHHDIEPLPNGNVLMIAWEEKTPAEAVAAGLDPANLVRTFFLPDHIIEVQPTGPTSGTVVWEWHVWDHLIQDHDPAQANYGVVADHPELVDINYAQFVNGQFNHANGVDYDPIHDWILVSAHQQNEIWIIDHSTTTAEAAGHTGGRWGKGGDLLYRWGNPEVYRRGGPSARQMKSQHAARFIPEGYPGAGHVTVFNNLFTATQSAVFELELPLDPAGNFILPVSGAYGPASPVWSYTTPKLFSQFQSSAERLPNGNTLICSSNQDWIFEVTPAGQLVWQHRGGGVGIFHAHHIRRSLWANDSELSAAQGGRIDFDLLQGTTAAGDLYLVLCSASGTTPGTNLFGVNLPLNIDPFFTASATYPNAAPVFVQTLGTLGGLGEAKAAFTLPPGLPGGYRLDFAYAVFQQPPFTVRTSNAVPVEVR